MSSLSLILHLPDGRQQTVNLPANVTIRRLIPALTSKLDLPTHDEWGGVLHYRLQVEAGGRVLGESLRLENAGKITQLYLTTTHNQPPPTPPAEDEIEIHVGEPVPTMSRPPNPPPAESRGQINWSRMLLYLGVPIFCWLAYVVNGASRPIAVEVTRVVAVTRIRVETMGVEVTREVTRIVVVTPTPSSVATIIDEGTREVVITPPIPTIASPMSPTIIEPNIMNGLIAHYPFDGNADDISGNQNHGTPQGVVSVHDRFGNPRSAYRFDGVDDYIEFQFGIERQPEFTQSLWVWISSDGWGKRGNVIQTAGGIIDYGWYNPNNLVLSIMKAGGLGSVTKHYFQFPIDDYYNDWHHFIFVAYEDDRARFFVNGEELATGIGTVDILITDAYETTMIGARKNSDDDVRSDYFLGRIDDVRLYDRAITPIEVQRLFMFEQALPPIPTLGPSPTPTLIPPCIVLNEPVVTTDTTSVNVMGRANDAFTLHVVDLSNGLTTTIGGLYQFDATPTTFCSGGFTVTGLDLTSYGGQLLIVRDSNGLYEDSQIILENG